MALGFAPRETASILSNTTIEWVLADLAVLSAGDAWLRTLLSQRSNSATWTFQQFDLGAYKGQSIKLYFGSYNNGSGGMTALYVDDMARAFRHAHKVISEHVAKAAE